jgi:uncharacterized membrane protein YsdA (DUF1294 family)
MNNEQRKVIRDSSLILSSIVGLGVLFILCMCYSSHDINEVLFMFGFPAGIVMTVLFLLGQYVWAGRKENG